MVKVKICGLTNLADYKLACQLGADYAGFIFYKNSPRFLEPELARKLVRQTKYSAIKVGVFVNEQVSIIREIYDYVGLDIVQLQGDEGPDFCRQLGLPYWKAIRAKDTSDVEKLKKFPGDIFLLDSFSGVAYGGTGKQLARSLLREALKTGKKIVVAGGLSDLNIGEIIKMKPFGVDVCSSLEESPGKKNPTKMINFLREVEKWRGQK
ncbi:MAG: phosphoribosylanthranilate isomerase [Acidobacteriota bacterium]|nr:phosphoribosylanthranilate isomerase [Acidobacteriota bacterium]